jgi:transcription-repair coupling factor (superfamily II helicase)
MVSANLIKNFFNIPADASRIYNLPGSSAALFLSLQKAPYIAVEQTEEAAAKLYEDIRFFSELFKEDAAALFFLPEPNGPGASGKRAEVINSIGDDSSIVSSVSAVNAPVWSPERLKTDSLYFVKGQETEREVIEQKLKGLGYKRVSIVVERGEYSTKGWLFDIFPSTSENPVRVELFGDEVDSIRSFDIESQRSLNRTDSLLLLPAAEPSDGGDEIASISDARRFAIDLQGGRECSADNAVLLSRFDLRGEGYDAGLIPIRGLGIYPDERKSIYDITQAIKSLVKDNSVVIVSPSDGQAERVKEILFDGGMVAPIVDAGQLIYYEGNIAIVKGRLSSGLFAPGLLIITERELFGERPAYRQLRKSKVSGLIASMDDISPGDLIVHKDHGIGRFIGIRLEAVGGYDTELIILEYRGGDRLYIPIYNIAKISKYKAEEGIAHDLDRLGGRTWQRTKDKVKKSIKEMTGKLLKLYAEREVSKGFSFSHDTEMHREFYGFFPYEETPDQLRTIDEIGADMQSERPMERLLCGDVGYGKTEVAMRAAFRAVYDGRQVAVLVPTTILCEQHYMTFTKRFSGFPVRIDYLSRFKTKKEQDMTLRALSKGEVDIIIGTHGLLRKGISFSNLGLLVIDEEHKFGVAQKERIKEFKKGIDVLSMTATPIPRTLQMALSGIRGMSVIETPPEDRLAVRSIVSVFSEELIKEAIGRELNRNGQVLFVHNFISDIEKMADMLKRFFPDARIAVGHGQTAERVLENVMLKFIKGEVDILVSTTIIGSGIDIPTANTIIINRADKIGLADLYQLRGRVGRSNVRAYAYFLIPGEDIIKDEAKKRLQAIKDMSFLGAGFRLAMKDMEIRGAGNLLGPQQSGQIHAVGFDMYVEMLEQAVAEMKGIETQEEVEPAINLKLSAYIPEEYIEDLGIRLSIYRRIANLRDMEGIESMGSEMTDRFGKMPEEVKRLMDIMRMKLIARRLLISSIAERAGKIRFVFADNTPVAPESIFGLQVRLSGIRFHKDGFEIDTKGLPREHDILSLVNDVLSGLAKI